jgi:hypothetical protein
MILIKILLGAHMHIQYLPKNEFIGNNFGYFSVGYQMKENYISNIKILIGKITKPKL